MTYTVFKIEREGYVTRVIMDRPKKSNAMGKTFWPEILDIFRDLDKDPETRAIVLTGVGKHFSSGIDMEETIGAFPLAGDGKTIELITASNFIAEIQQSINSVENCRKPVIAAIHGACIGAGLDLAAACDFRFASADAYFSLRDTRVGVVADLGSLQRLPGIIGQGHTRELAYTAMDIDAEHALDIGLVNSLHEGRDACIDAAMAAAQLIAQNAPLAVQVSKQVLNYCLDKSIHDGLDYVAARNSQIIRSADVVEAVIAFLQKRDPKFKGR